MHAGRLNKCHYLPQLTATFGLYNNVVTRLHTPVPAQFKMVKFTEFLKANTNEFGSIIRYFSDHSVLQSKPQKVIRTPPQRF